MRTQVCSSSTSWASQSMALSIRSCQYRSTRLGRPTILGDCIRGLGTSDTPDASARIVTPRTSLRIRFVLDDRRAEVEEIHCSTRSKGHGGRSIGRILGGRQARRHPLDFVARSFLLDVVPVGADEAVSRQLVDQEPAQRLSQKMTIADVLNSGRREGFLPRRPKNRGSLADALPP